MEKTINISGKNVTFRKTGATMPRYKELTGREFYADLYKFLNIKGNKSIQNKIKTGKKIERSDIDFDIIDFDYMYDMLHIMARGADKTVPADKLEWLEEFDEFPVVQIFIDILPMLSAEMAINPKN